MPHVRVIFVEDEDKKNLLRAHKGVIRSVVARNTGYSLDEVAIIPEMIRTDVADLADNLLPLEFVIDVGVKCLGLTEHVNRKIQDDLMSCVEGLYDIEFGIWLRTMTDNSFMLHSPK